MSVQRWQDWAVLVLGAWLLLSPFALEYVGTPAASTAYVVGLALVLFALLAMIDRRIWEAWANLVLGGWLIVAPFVLGYTQALPVTLNHVAVGVLIVASMLRVIARAPLRPSRAAAR